MYFSKTTIVSFGLLATSKLVAGHAAIIAATGDQGGQGSAIGIDPATPRDGTRRNPFQQDATRFRGNAADSCGETLGGGDNDVETGTQGVMSLNGDTLPQISQGGEISMTLHQVNGDGAGPYTCMIDATGTGTNWTPIQVTQNVDGNARGRNRDTQMQDLPLTAAIPANQECTGTVAGQTNVCMVRCENPARAGPFGGCVPVQMVQQAGNANNANNANNAANNANNNANNANLANDNANNANLANDATGVNNNANLANDGTGAVNNGNNANLANDATGVNNNANLANDATGVNNNANLANDGTGAVNNGNNANLANDATGVNNNANLANDATGVNGAANNQQLNNANTVPANNNLNGATNNVNNAANTLQRRAAKKLSATGPSLTDDDQEEEVDLLESDIAKRWIA